MADQLGARLAAWERSIKIRWTLITLISLTAISMHLFVVLQATKTPSIIQLILLPLLTGGLVGLVVYGIGIMMTYSILKHY